MIPSTTEMPQRDWRSETPAVALNITDVQLTTIEPSSTIPVSETTEFTTIGFKGIIKHCRL